MELAIGFAITRAVRSPAAGLRLARSQRPTSTPEATAPGKAEPATFETASLLVPLLGE